MATAGEAQLSGARTAHRLTVDLWRDEAWRAVPLSPDGDGYAGALDGDRVALRLEKADEGWRYELRLDAARPTRARLGLELPGAEDPYHVLPAVLFGDNNLAVTPTPIFPHLATGRDEPNCAPYWECRADRCSHPASLVAWSGHAAAVSIDLYCDDAEDAGERRPADDDDLAETVRADAPFVRNGVFARIAHDGQPVACGVTLGYRNDPRTYVSKRSFTPPTSHRLAKGTARGRIFLREAADRRGLHAVVRTLYDELRTPPTPRIGADEGMRRVADAMTRIGWIPDQENWADMKWDWDAGRLATFRGANHEIAWTGGTQSAYPLLVYGHRRGDDEAVRQARIVLDRIAADESYCPATGWMYDSRHPETGEPGPYGWWPKTTPTAHYAYTNGEATAYLLQAFRYARDEMRDDRPAWRDAALRVLEQALRIQTPEGNFGYAYSGETGELIDPDGFAGCWFVPALVLAWVETGADRFLDAARRGLAHYAGFVRDLSCWGTPMDTAKAVDQEGVLAFIRGARLLHQFAGDADALAHLADGAMYEYLYRFAVRTRPEAPPLRDSSWNACGGSITSTSNQHIHPMGILVSGDLAYLAEKTGDDYHRRRVEDGLLWSLGCIELYPDETGYGAPGVLTERFCPSDGLLSERYPDGTPASVWWSYHVWGAADILEGLLDA